MIDHEDLDRVAAEGLVDAGTSAVVNASRSISGRYPSLGPLILAEAGIPLIDHVGPLIMSKVREGEPVRVDGDRIYADGSLVGVGTLQTKESILRDMETAKKAVEWQFESFARNTMEYLEEERDLLFGGSGLPDLQHNLAGRPVLVVVRGYNYREDLAALRPYISDVHPVLIGVDGGADALVDEGYVPDLIIGDMDSVSDAALLLSLGPRRRRGLRERIPPTELIVHAYRDGYAPGLERIRALGLPCTQIASVGTSEDVAFLLAHEKGASLIVAVGSHGNLREFLDKGRHGMASTFLVRLRVGEILMDAKGVSRLYPGRSRRWDAVVLGLSAMLLFGLIWLGSPALRLYLNQEYDQLLDWIRQLL